MKKAITLLMVSAVILNSDVAIIAHQNVPKIDKKSIAKVFTGKMISIDGENLIPINHKDGTTREQFLSEFVELDNENYIAYWTVRKHIGKGTPPLELGSSEDVIKFIHDNPGAIGYIDSKDIKPGLNVIVKK